MACTRVCASSLVIALRMCVFTVSLDSTSRSATSSPVRPWASRSMISRSRLDSDGMRCVVSRESSAGRSRGSTYVPPRATVSRAPVSSLGVPSLSA